MPYMAWAGEHWDSSALVTVEDEMHVTYSQPEPSGTLVRLQEYKNWPTNAQLSERQEATDLPAVAICHTCLILQLNRVHIMVHLAT